MTHRQHFSIADAERALRAITAAGDIDEAQMRSLFAAKYGNMDDAEAVFNHLFENCLVGINIDNPGRRGERRRVVLTKEGEELLRDVGEESLNG